MVQWGLVYAAAAWGFLQGLEYVSAGGVPVADTAPAGRAAHPPNRPADRPGPLPGTTATQVDGDLRLADEGMRLALEATTQALALDPNYAPSHASLAWIALFFDRDLAAAARHLERALALDAANPDIIATAAVLARRLGRLDQAISIGEYLARKPEQR